MTVERAKLVDAAARVYGEFGFRGATTRRIADEAGVNEITIFRQFGSKEALINEAVRTHAVRPPFPNLPVVPADPRRELTEWADVVRAHMSDARSLIRRMMSEMEERPAVAPCIGEGPMRAASHLQGYIARLSTYGFLPADPETNGANIAAATSMLMSALFADAMGRDMMPAMYPQPAERAPAAYVDVFLRALGVRVAAGAQPRATPSTMLRTAAGIAPVLGAIVLGVLAVVSAAPAARAQRVADSAAARPAAPGATPAAPSTSVVLASGTRQPNTAVMSLADAVRVALSKSEAVRIAQAGVMRARGEVDEALSNWWPQLTGTAAYTRTLQTQYTALAKATATVDTSHVSQVALCSPPIDSLSTPAQRQSAFNKALSCPNNNGFGGINFASVGFGSLNQYTLGLNFSQTIFNGQVLAQSQAAKSPRRSAEIEVGAQRAQVTYDVTQAYYDAALADRLVVIAESTLAQSDRTLKQTQLTKRVGTQSEFDLLQAQVTRNNQVPIVIQRRGDRDIAYYRLKQLVKLPLDAPLQLTTDVEDSTAAPDGVRLASVETVTDSEGVVMAAETIKLTTDTGADRRSTVREQAETVKENTALLRAANSERLPAIVLTSQYQRVAYPLNLPSWADFLTNWNVGVGLSVPIFTGRRIKGDEMVAQANLDDAKARLQQTRELAVLDARTAIETLREAQAAWAASVGTVTQATRAYQIAELRYREGISTQIELTDQRIAQQQALANRAQAARNLQVARVRLGLIADLPLSSAGAGASASQSAAQGNPTAAPPGATQPPAQTTGPAIPGQPSTTAPPQSPTYPAANQAGSPAP